MSNITTNLSDTVSDLIDALIQLESTIYRVAREIPAGQHIIPPANDKSIPELIRDIQRIIGVPKTGILSRSSIMELRSLGYLKYDSEQDA